MSRLLYLDGTAVDWMTRLKMDKDITEVGWRPWRNTLKIKSLAAVIALP